VAPDLLELCDAGHRGVAGEVCTVDRAGRRADDQVGSHARGRQRAQHADLHRAEAAAAGEHEGRRALRVHRP